MEAVDSSKVWRESYFFGNDGTVCSCLDDSVASNKSIKLYIYPYVVTVYSSLVFMFALESRLCLDTRGSLTPPSDIKKLKLLLIPLSLSVSWHTLENIS